METRRVSAARWLLGALVVTAAIAVFAPTLHNGFVTWDDDIYITGNPWTRGLSLGRLRWMLTAGRAGLWQPLTWLSFALDYSVWGLEPCGYHLTNILLHAAAALLFYGVCLDLFERAWPKRDPDGPIVGAALAALFFAVHPLRVESVAWATERKGLLAGAFWMAALLARLKAVGSKSGRRGMWEAAALAAFTLSLSAKVFGLTLPFVLMILEVYPLKRLPADPRRWLERPLRPVVSSTAPYFILAAGGLAANLIAAASSNVLLGFSAQGAVGRLDQILYGLLFYPAKTLWPSSLAAYYPPRPWFGRWSREFFACALAVMAVAAAIGRSSRRWPVLGAVALGYAVMLAPNSGLAQHGIVYSACDRFSYLPCLGFAVLFGVLFAGRAARVLGAVWLAVLGCAAWTQCAVWRDSQTLWSVTALRAPSAIAFNNIGTGLVGEGKPEEGKAWFEKSIAAFPRSPLGYDNLGVMLQRSGQEGAAREFWIRGLAQKATPEMHAHLGASLAEGGAAELSDGIAHLRAAAAQSPEAAAFRVDLADALVRAGLFNEAGAQYAEAVSLDPGAARAQNNWGLLLAGQGKLDGALGHYRLALRSATDRAQAQYNWGNIALGKEKLDQAERHFREALRIDPSLAQAQVNLGNILARRGDLNGAVDHYRAALKNDPGLAQARVNLAAVRRALGR